MISLAIGKLKLTLKLKVGKKGYIILPKAIREAVGINEGDEVIVEIKDGIILKPIKIFDEKKLKTSLMEHLDRIKKIPDLIEPKIGELAKVYLEEEFEY